MNGSKPGRQPWKYKKTATQYHRSTGYAAYTMVFNAALEAEMVDSGIAKESRVLAAIKRFSWGRLSDFAVDAMPPEEIGDPKPKPLTQEAIGAIIGLATSTVSEAAIYLKEAGYLRKDHRFLFPEKKVSSLESSGDSGVNPDSSDSHSPYLRFKSSYLSENKDLNEILTQFSEERNKLQDAARKLSSEIRKQERIILAAFRDWEREHPDEQAEQNQQLAETSGKEVDPTRLCAHAQNDTTVVGEGKANKDPLRDLSYSLESDPNSNPEKSATPNPQKVESGSYSKQNANETATRQPSSLKPLKSEYKNAHTQSVSQSSQETDRLTDRQRDIVDSIPEELREAFGTPPVKLLNQIDIKIGPAPLSAFAERIRDRWVTITSLGILPGLAADALRIWNKVQKDAEGGIPIKSEKRSALDQALDEVEYGN